MNSLAVQAPPVAILPIAGSNDKFPVRRVYCIGGNYGTQASNLEQGANREPPFIFQKNPDNLNSTGVFPYPSKTANVQHEVELAIMLKSGASNIPFNNALDHVYGYALSLDMTRRDLQKEQKKMGRPWEIGKAFEHSAPVGLIYTVDDVGHLTEGRVELKVNGKLKQEGNLNQMIWKVPEIIAYLSGYFTLASGDVILSGTPPGVGPVEIGDILELSIERLDAMSVSVV